MASEVSICNAALQLVKHTTQITSLSQGTKQATACEVIYEEMRDTLLEMHTWNFATSRVKLARLVATPVFEWSYGYQLPADFLRAVSVHENANSFGATPYKIEGGHINTDATDLYLRYIQRVSDPNLMPPTFRSALTKLLGSRLAVALAQSMSLSEKLYAQFLDQDLPTAKSTDAVQGHADDLPESSWISARYGGARNYEPGEVS